MINRFTSSRDYRLRRGEISAYGRAENSFRQLSRLFIIVSGVLFVALVLMALLWPVHNLAWRFVLVAIAVFLLLGMSLIYWYNHKHFVEPDMAFRVWLQNVCDGELGTHINLDNTHPHYKELDFHTRNLSAALRDLSDEMDALVESQTNKLNEQKSVLEFLYKLTADVSSETDNESAFVTTCHHLAQWFQAARVLCYRVNNSSGNLDCIAIRRSVDDDNNPRVLIEQVDQNNHILVSANMVPDQVTMISSADNSDVDRIWVPFFVDEQLTGVVLVEQAQSKQFEHPETERLLSTVSEQLSLLCTKQLVQEQMVRSQLNLDRNELAAEIHDSLAQTLLAIRYQTALLSEKLKQRNEEETYQDIVSLNGSIEEANEEVRGLIREFRNPLTKHRNADSLQQVLDEFSKKSGVAFYFQADDPQIRFTPREESTLQRILREALNNTEKYAKATMVRVYLQRDISGARRVLIEDDGVGFALPEVSSVPLSNTSSSGDHIGLDIMQERAVSIAGKLSIDSEPEEGTRITIELPPLFDSSDSTTTSFLNTDTSALNASERAL